MVNIKRWLRAQVFSCNQSGKRRPNIWQVAAAAQGMIIKDRKVTAEAVARALGYDLRLRKDVTLYRWRISPKIRIEGRLKCCLVRSEKKDGS